MEQIDNVEMSLNYRMARHGKLAKRNLFWDHTLSQITIILTVLVPFGIFASLKKLGPPQETVIIITLIASALALVCHSFSLTMKFRAKFRFHKEQEADYATLWLELSNHQIDDKEALKRMNTLMKNDAKEP
jgi:hypothetical protein